VILGVSHLAVRSADLERDTEALESQGWATAFVDHAVRVHPFERPFSSPGHPDHQSLVLLRHPAGAPAVELVGPVLTPERAQRTELNLSDAARGVCHGTIRVPNFAETVELFIEVLGFRRDETKDGASVELALRRPLSHWSMPLTIREDLGATQAPMMDSPGWFVLALFSSDPRADAHRMHAYHVQTTEPFVTRVSDQQWTIVLCVLQSGFAIELLQPSKGASS
jgi:hypothetical protein